MTENTKKLGILIPLLTIFYGMYVSTESAPLLMETTRALSAVDREKLKNLGKSSAQVDINEVLNPFELERAIEAETEVEPDALEEKEFDSGLEEIDRVYVAGPFKMVLWKDELLRSGQSFGDLRIVKILEKEIHVSYKGRLLVLEGRVKEELVNGVLIAGALRAAVLGGKILSVGEQCNGIKVVDVSLEEVTLTVDEITVVSRINPRPQLAYGGKE